MAEVTGTSSSINYYNANSTNRSTGSDLGKEDFLKLLVAQLTMQDPTQPMSDTEFVSQLANYSALEQQITTNKNLESLIAINQVSNIAAATATIGKLVGYTAADGTSKAQLVEFIDVYNGDVYLYLSDGSYIPFSAVEQIGIPREADSGSGDADTDTPATDDTGSGDSGTEEAGAGDGV